MQVLGHLLQRTVRWGWLFFLILIAFRHLTSGLSETPASLRNAALTSNQAKPSTKLIDSSVDSFTGKPDSLSGNLWTEDDQKDLHLSIENANRIHDSHLLALGLRKSEVADWLTICRRLSLALVGSGLSLEEIRELENYPTEQRERVHLQNLLADSRHHHYWAERWARYLVGTEGGQFIVYRRRRFRIWLTEVISENRPYDQMVHDLLTAEGLWTDRPEVNFYTATFDSNDGNADPIRLAARTARVFLGLRIDCLQCHDDFLGNVNLGDADQLREGKQEDFHQLASFFTAAKTNGLQGIKSGFSDYKYQYLDENQEVTVEPKVPYAEHLMPKVDDPRERLAGWITHPDNKQAARSAVSHIWGLLFGLPIGNSVDNLPLDEEAHPLLDALAQDFIQHRYDMRRLIRVISGLDAFRLDSRADFTVTQKHESEYAVFPLVQLRPEQVAGSIIQASRIKKTDRDSSLLLQFQKLAATNEFVQRFGDRGEDELESEHVTITQRLLMMNGKMVRESVESNPILNTTAHLSMFAKDDSMVVDNAYLCVLNRLPTQTEQERFLQRLKESQNRSEAIEDLMWVLTNSSELTWNH